MYFRILGIFFGLVAFLKPFYLHILPWDENTFIKKAYTKERPKWILGVSIIGLILVGITWYMHFTLNVKYSIIITLLFSLTAIKGLTFIFNYRVFYEWVSQMLSHEDGKKIVKIDIGVSILGLIIIILSMKLY